MFASSPRSLPRRATSSRIAAGTWFSVCALLAGLPAHAENWPVYFSASESLSHDSNLFRRDDNVVSDTLSTTSATVGIDKAYGRQNYSAALTGSINRYNNNDQLNYQGYSADGGFATTIGSDLSFNAYGSRGRSLASFDTGSNRRAEKNIRNSSSVGANLRYGLYGRMSVGVSASHFTEDFTATSSGYPTQRSSSYGADVRYTPQPQLSMSVGLRHSPGRTSYEADQTAGTSELEFETKTNNLDFGVGWEISGLSTLNARLSYTKQDQSPTTGNSVLVGKDFKGWTGALDWRYTPRGLLSYNVGLSRDTTNNASLNSFGENGRFNIRDQRLVLDTSASSGDNRVTTRLSAGVNWQATAKISAGLNASVARLDTRLTTAETIISGGTERTVFTSQNQTGTLSTYGLSASYVAQRWLSFGCNVQRFNRTRDLYSGAYDATTFGCSATATLNGQN